MQSICWLPDLIYCEDLTHWPEYESNIYDIFFNDFISSCPIFCNKRVAVRHHPKLYDKEEAFYHVTCQDYQYNHDRSPDLRRCERIRWIRSFIENYSSCDSSICIDCDGIKLWNEPYKSTYRTYLLLEEERYVVVLEKRDSYFLLITAFYIEQDHYLRKLIKRFEATLL